MRAPISWVALDCMPVTPSISGSMTIVWRGCGGSAGSCDLPSSVLAALATASSKDSTGGGAAGGAGAAGGGAGAGACATGAAATGFLASDWGSRGVESMAQAVIAKPIRQQLSRKVFTCRSIVALQK